MYVLMCYIESNGWLVEFYENIEEALKRFLEIDKNKKLRKSIIKQITK